MYCSTRVEVISQLMGVDSLLSPSGSQGLRSGHYTWQQVPLTAGTS